jgi:hypothetical protein
MKKIKKADLEKLISDIAEGKVEVTTLDDETKERLLRLAIRKVRIMRLQSIMLVMKDFSYLVALILLGILLYNIYDLLHGYLNPLILP